MNNVYQHFTLPTQSNVESLRQIEHEKLKIARELHDCVLQEQIVAMRELDMVISDVVNLTNEDIKFKLRQVKELQANAIYELRNFCQSHYTPRFGGRDLQNHIQYLLDRIELRNNIEIRYRTEGLFVAINGERSLHLYRIIQELLHNTEKHANASVIELFMKYDEEVIEVEYRDNGVGSDHLNLTSYFSLGLKGIISRAECLNAQIQMESALNEGFSFKLVIPVLPVFQE